MMSANRIFSHGVHLCVLNHIINQIKFKKKILIVLLSSVHHLHHNPSHLASTFHFSLICLCQLFQDNHSSCARASRCLHFQANSYSSERKILNLVCATILLMGRTCQLHAHTPHQWYYMYVGSSQAAKRSLVIYFVFQANGFWFIHYTIGVVMALGLLAERSSAIR